MKTTTKLLVVCIFLLGIFSSWYLFIKPYDYQIQFSKKTSPGTIYKQIESWTTEENNEWTIINEKKEPYENINQEFSVDDSLLVLKWGLSSKNDSITDITVRIKDSKNSLSTRVQNLYKEPTLKKMFLSQIEKFNTNLNSHLKRHKVEIIGEDTIPEQFYAYLSVECLLSEKAMTMISENAEIAGWLNDNSIKILSQPSLEVTSWNIENDSIRYNFLFPIKESDSIPFHEKIKFKKYKAKKGLKANFYGNYRFSDRAWFALLEYAKRNEIKTEQTPIEFFFNNPMLGGQELEWKAEVYLPLE